MSVGKQSLVDKEVTVGAAAYQRLPKDSMAAKALGHDDKKRVVRKASVAPSVVVEPAVEDAARVNALLQEVANLRRQCPGLK